jgi:UDP-4-amino-4,6-dideoxy-N-acetyl-beta-L-altrosamine transaminase
VTDAPFLPYGRQDITEEDIAAVTAALRDPMITQGPRVAEFERAFADHVGARHAVTFANGTGALHAAADAAGLGPGDELITSPLTFVASANCALFVGATPRLMDVDPATWNLDTATVAATAGPGCKAVVPVSLAGLPVNLEPLQPLRERGVKIIEDGCHALGGHRDGTPVGGPSGADMTVFSLHPVKPITTGEGGIVTTEDDELAARLRAFATHGIAREDLGPDEGAWYYEVRELGFNYRLTDVQCALGLSQLQRLDHYARRRNEVAAQYRERLAGDERVGLAPEAPDGSRHGYHLFVVHVAAELRRTVFEHLRAAGIGVQVHYVPIYRFPLYKRLGHPQDACPNAERYYATAISLPIFPAMTEDDVDRVVAELDRALG